MVKDMCSSFLDTEVMPIVDRIDKMEHGLMPGLMTKAGEQGLLGVSIPALCNPGNTIEQLMSL